MTGLGPSVGACIVLLLIAAGAGAAFALLFRIHRDLREEHRALLKEKEVIFNYVHDVGEIFAESETVQIEPLMEKVLFYALRATHAGAGAIYLVDPDGRTLRARTVSGLFPPLAGGADLALDRAVSKSQHIERAVRAQRIPVGEGLLGQVADYGTATIVADGERDSRVPRYDEDLLRVTSLVAVPMRFHGRTLGVMALVNRIDAHPFVQSDLNLAQALADQASVAAHYALLHEDLDAKKRIDNDLRVARRIQEMLLPRELPVVAGVEMAGFNVPAQEIGGDYYDVLPIDDRHVGIAVADVSGKGIGGALLMSVCRSLLRARAPGVLRPAAVLRDVNRGLAGDLTEDLFVTALYLVLDTVTRELVYARAGHERAFRYRPADGTFEVLDSPGIALGMSTPDVFDAALADGRTSLAPGDVVVAYTDGISEAMNPAGEEWGVESLKTVVRTAAASGAHGVVDHVRQRLQRFVGEREPYDDMTMVVFRIGT
jgi:sigma-B regulation protein RsbU (phosphoserine phosphatase)